MPAGILLDETNPDRPPVQHALIISSDAKQQEALRKALELENATVHSAADLSEASTLLAQQPTRLIFVQHSLVAGDQLPGIDNLREACEPEPTRIVALLDNPLTSKRDLVAAGFDDVLRTPVDLADIAFLIASAERVVAPAPTPEPIEEAPRIAVDAEVLRQLSLDLSWSTTIEQQAQHGLTAASKIFDTLRGAVWMRDVHDRSLRCIAARGLSDDYHALGLASLNYMSQDDWVSLSRRPVFAIAPETAPGLTIELMRAEEIDNALIAALFTPSDVIGALALFDIAQSDEAVDDELIQLIDTVTAVTAMALDQTRLRDDLSNSEATYRQLVEEMPNGVFIHDAHGNFLMSNSAIESICGFSEDDLALMNLYDLVLGGPDGPDGNELAEILAEITNQQNDDPDYADMFGPVTLNLLAADGRHIEAELYFRSLRLRGREDEHWIQAMARDITNEVRAFRELEALRGVAESLTGIDNEYQALQETLKRIRGSIDYLHASIWRLSPDNVELICTAQTGIEFSKLLADPDAGLAGEALQTGQPRHVAGIESGQHDAAVHRLVVEIAAVPIIADDRPLGVLQVQVGSERQLQPADIDFLESVSAQIAGRMERHELVRNIEKLDASDAATGLDNRRTFYGRLRSACESAGDKPVSLLHIGIDDFKSLNDSYGHLIGDDLLRQVGETIASQLAPPYHLARYGGDEFCVILPGVSRDEIPAVAENVRIGVATQLFSADEQLEQLTVSIGAATLPDDVKGPDGLVSAASDATSMAKRAGRNQVYQSNSAFGELSMQHDQLVESLKRAPQDTLALLVRAMDERMPGREGHAVRVARIATQLGRQLGLDETDLEQLGIAAYVHDIGMFLIPDEMLRKPLDLSSAERERLSLVPAVAHRLLTNVALPPAVSLAVVHQYEHWDGSGHPGRLVGTSIPLAARIIAVADAVDAMTSDRAHRDPLPLAQVIENLEASAGSRFDPEVVAAAVDHLDGTVPPGEEVKSTFLRDSLELLGV